MPEDHPLPDRQQPLVHRVLGGPWLDGELLCGPPQQKRVANRLSRCEQQ
jgi:hypothetical protein